MNKIFTLSAALMLCASMSMAQGIGLYVGVDCNPAASQAVTNACTTNTGTAFTAFVTAVIPPAAKPQFVGTISIIDVQTNLPTIPDWWRADACRGTGFSMAADNTIGGATCAATIWDTANPAGSNLSANLTTGGVRERFLLGTVLLPTDVFDLSGDGTTEVAIAKWTVTKAKSVTASACAGCAQGACIVLNEVQIQGTGDHQFEDYLHLTTPIGTKNWISYNTSAPGDIPVCPDAVPVRNRTWGSVKALYR